MRRSERISEALPWRPRPAAVAVDASSLWSDCRARLLLPARWKARAALRHVRRLAGGGLLALTADGAVAHPALPLYALPSPIRVITVDWKWDNTDDEYPNNKKNIEETCLGLDVVDNNCTNESGDKKQADLVDHLIATECNGGNSNNSEIDLSEAKRRALLVLQRIERGAPRRKRNRKRRMIDQKSPCANDDEEDLGQQEEALGQHEEALGQHEEALGQHEEALGQHEEALGQHEEALGEAEQGVVVRNGAARRGPRIVRGLP